MKLIMVSGHAGSGKDTFSNYLHGELMYHGNCDFNDIVVVHFADALKAALRDIFNWDGNKDAKGRSLLQNVGQTIRETYDGFWSEYLARILKTFEERWKYVIISDWRYADEYDMMCKYFDDVITVRIERDNYNSVLTDEQKSHISETGLDDFVFHYTIHNNGTPDDLIYKIIDFIEDYLDNNTNNCYNNDEN